MNIAILGCRGVPAKYGGFETFAEELGKRLVERGHSVHVYSRSSYYAQKPETCLGMQVIYIRDLKIKFLETLVHTFLSLIHALRKEYDFYLVLNSANSPLMFLLRLWKKRSALHVDGLEWKRGKWNRLGRLYYRFAERIAVKAAKNVITDSRSIQDYYKARYRKETRFIPYGAEVRVSRDSRILEQFDLEPEAYFLQITRFEPENNPHLTIGAFERLETDKRLVLVGGAKYKSPYVRELLATQDERILFLGYQYDKDIIRELYCNCFAYIHGNEVGGTNPALLEAMSSGCFVISRDVPFNREVLQDAGLYYDKDEDQLLDLMSRSLNDPEALSLSRQKASSIIERRYSWDSVVDEYIDLFQN